MKQSSSTTTSAPTDIGESLEYCMMSSDIMDQVSLDYETAGNTGTAQLDFEGGSTVVRLVSLEIDDEDGLLFTVEKDGIMLLLIDRFIKRSEFTLSFGGRRFKVESLKLDSNRCYLRSKR